METEIIPFDLTRMLLGEQPWLFYAEILLRVAVIYAYTLLMIRWIGGRGVAQLSLVELLLVIALGSAVGDAMFYPEVPLLVALLVVTAVVVINKALDRLIVRSERVKHVIDGRPVSLVRDGALDMAGLDARDLGATEVKAMLRIAGISNLGQVEHAFLEVSGAVSVFRARRPLAGLRIVPPQDVLPQAALDEPLRAPGGLACCAHCGRVSPAASAIGGDCAGCARREWVAPELPEPADSVAEA